MGDDELILAYANPGVLVEGWLKSFYCIYYYCNNAPVLSKQGDIIGLNDLQFEKLKQFN